MNVYDQAIEHVSVLRTASAIALAMCLSGCATIGPDSLPGDQFNYNAAISESIEQQLLTAMVRMRYSETPTFLKVSSVISQYSRTMGVVASAGANTSIAGDNTASATARAGWSDRPTITYVPISGSEFARNLLKPLPPDALFGMMLAGWPAELVVKVSIWSMNGLDNDVARPSRRRQADDELYQLFALWRTLRQENAMGLKLTAREGGGEEMSLVFPSRLPAGSQQDAQRFRELLGLSQDADEIGIAYGLIPEGNDDIAVLTGSIWDIMLNLSWQFEVPQEHVDKGRTDGAFQSSHSGGVAPIEVRFAKEPPKDPFVATFVHDHWFYIEQNDRRSKRAFSFLQLLMNLAETPSPDRSPAITISQ
jgi:hypothetical protein